MTLVPKLDEALGRAAILAGDFEKAEGYYLKALLSKELSPEPLIRVYLIQGRFQDAQEIFRSYSEQLDQVERFLLRELLIGEKTVSQIQESEEPSHHLYRGLLLVRSGQMDLAETELTEYVLKADWGWSLAEPVLLGEGHTQCQACLQVEAQHLLNNLPLCDECKLLITDPFWTNKAYYDPSPEQREIMKRVFGMDMNEWLCELEDANYHEQLKAKASFTPLQSIPVLICQLDPQLRELFGKAALDGELTVRSFVDLIAGGEFDESLFSSPGAQAEFHSLEVPEGVDCHWLLNVANWYHLLSIRPGEDGVSLYDLKVALEFVLGIPGIVARATTDLLRIRMGEQQVECFRELLLEKPNDLFLRSLLASPGKEVITPEQALERRQHVLWLIRNYPFVAQQQSWAGTDPKEDFLLAEAWVQEVRSKSDDPRVLGAAAAFFRRQDEKLSAALLLRCHALEPHNPEWAEELAELGLDEKKNLAYLEMALEMSSKEASYSLLTRGARLAFDAQEWGKAKAWAEELLNYGVQEEHWNFGNAKNEGHTVLGLLALQNENIELAEHHLLESVNSEGSPQLNSFGPNTELAFALLDYSENGIFFQFCERVRVFWQSSIVDQWESDLKSGRRPDFEH